MQRVIAGYQTFSDARRAVHALERRDISTQDISISDETLSFDRKLRPSSAQKRRWGGQPPRFLVAMSGQLDAIASATDILLRRDSAEVSAMKSP